MRAMLLLLICCLISSLPLRRWPPSQAGRRRADLGLVGCPWRKPRPPHGGLHERGWRLGGAGQGLSALQATACR